MIPSVVAQVEDSGILYLSCSLYFLSVEFFVPVKNGLILVAMTFDLTRLRVWVRLWCNYIILVMRSAVQQLLRLFSRSTPIALLRAG